MLIAIYEHHRNPEPAQADVTWPEFVELMSTHPEAPCTANPTGVVPPKSAPPQQPEEPCRGKTCCYKFCNAFSPVEIKGNRRLDANVVSVSMLVLDFDNVDDRQGEQVAEAIRPYRAFIHTTHRHLFGGEGHNYLRSIIPFSRPVLAQEYPQVRRAAVALLDVPSDPTCKDRSRLYFLPTHAKGGEFWHVAQEGKALDVDELLAMELPEMPLPPPTFAPVDYSDEPPPEIKDTDLDSLRKCLIATRQRKNRSRNPSDHERAETLGRILKGATLAVPGDFQGETDAPKGRNAELHRIASLFAFILPAETPVEAAWQLLAPSLEKTDLETDAENWFELFERSYARGMDRRIEVDKERDIRHAQQDREYAVVRQQIHDRILTPAAPKPPPDPNAPVDPNADPNLPQVEEDPYAWVDDLVREKGELKNNGANIELIIRNDPATKGAFRFNRVSKMIEITRGYFAQYGHWPLEVVVTKLTNWLQQEPYNLYAKSREDVGAQVSVVAWDNSYDPMVEFVTAQVWDGVSRVDKFLLDYIKCRRVNQSGEDISEHLVRVGRCFWISMIARMVCTGIGRDGMPGEQVDAMMVLEGLEGKYKTSALRVIGRPWFAETTIELGTKDSKMLTTGHALIEVSELSSFKRAEVEQLKSYLTVRVETFRPPYGRSDVSLPRRAVLAGTTNDEDGYLVPQHGKRRFMPVWVEAIDLTMLKQDRDQLIAESYVRYRNGERWWLDEEEQKIANAETEERITESEVSTKIKNWWFEMAPTMRPEFITTLDVAEIALKLNASDISKSLQMEVGQTLRAMGMKRVQRRAEGGPRVWGYESTPALRSSKQRQSVKIRMLKGNGK